MNIKRTGIRVSLGAGLAVTICMWLGTVATVTTDEGAVVLVLSYTLVWLVDASASRLLNSRRRQ
jgi:hypothetical protein